MGVLGSLLGIFAPPPERVHGAESPRAACVAQGGGLARLASDAAPHGRAAEEGGSLHREERNERQTDDERRE